MMRVISDIHLGSRHCETKLVNRFLDTYDGPLIINGDLIDNWKMHKWERSHLILLDRFRLRSDTIFIAGNHEVNKDVASQITGLKWVEHYVLNNIFICHGHQWDKWIGYWPLTDLADLFYNSLDKKTAKLVKRAFKGVITCISGEALKLDYHYVICGHTHYAMNIKTYWNCGCWTEPPGTWISITDNIITLRRFDE